MIPFLLIAAQSAAVPVEEEKPAETIVVTASRAPEEESRTAASVTIVDEQRIVRLGTPLLADLLRFAPSTAVTQTGPAGTLTEVRIRGAEANHTLLFIDGIRANDPARGETPRFELLNADIVSRIEVVRGPQSALWGSEAIGGVVAVSGATMEDPGAAGEFGSFGFRRASLSAGVHGLAGAVAWQSSRGIDIFGGGDRDGYRNLAARLRGAWQASRDVELGASGFFLSGRSEYDGPNPLSFEPSHPLLSKDRMAAGRVWATIGGEQSPWRGSFSVARLASKSRNFFESNEINRTSGSRTTIAVQGEHRFASGDINHLLVAAAEHEKESFAANDTIFGGATAQEQDRTHSALTLEWRATAGPLTADVAVRQDAFNRFKDATSLRASLLVGLGRGFALTAAYAKGIAQPTFFDLFGFFPGTFQGNPELAAERSSGFEASLRYRRDRFDAGLTVYRQRLEDEIVNVFDFESGLFKAVNRGETSRRRGLEAEIGWAPAETLRLAASYSYLDATQPGASISAQVRETRRPKHSGSVTADGRIGRFSYGGALTYSGARTDVNEQFPFQTVRLGAYWLAGARIAYALRPGVELSARASNLFDENYQDVFGYRTEGRAVFVGVRLGDRRSSP